MIQRTLVLIKPDAVQRGIVGEIISRFERVGLHIAGMKLIQPTDEQARRHYADLAVRYGQEVFDRNVQMLKMGPVVALAIEGDEAVAVVRKMVGDTYPNLAAPGTIRGDYCHISKAQATVSGKSVLNVVHASSKPEETAGELDIWFRNDELIKQRTLHTLYTVYGP